MEALLNPLIVQGSRVFSVAGSGGKTTLIRNAALHYAETMHVGVAASTKMLLPDSQWQYKGMIPPVVSPESGRNLEGAVPPICFYTEHLLPEGKIWDIGERMLQLAMAESQILFIEADGSNRKPLKGWREDEPVVPAQTDVIIGVLPLHCLGRKIEEAMVHRIEAFSTITGLKYGDRMTADAYVQLITHPNGLFGHAKGRRLLVMNRADNGRLQGAASDIAFRSGFSQGEWIAGCLLDE